MIYELIKSAGRAIRRFGNPDYDPSSEPAPGEHPRWRLAIRESRPDQPADTTWMLEAVHHPKDRRVARIDNIEWHNTVRATHQALKVVEDHFRPVRSSTAAAVGKLSESTNGSVLTAEEMADLYLRNGAEYGPAIATVKVSSLRYQIHINQPEAKNFEDALNEVYSPAEPPQKPRRRWTAQETNPRHPRWMLHRKLTTTEEQWSLTAIHKGAESNSGARIKKICWTRSVTEAGAIERLLPPAETRHSPAAIVALVEQHSNPGTSLTIQVAIGGMVYERPAPRRDAEMIKEILDSLYDPAD